MSKHTHRRARVSLVIDWSPERNANNADERKIKIMNFRKYNILKEECSQYTQILYLVSVFIGRNMGRS